MQRPMDRLRTLVAILFMLALQGAAVTAQAQPEPLTVDTETSSIEEAPSADAMLAYDNASALLAEGRLDDAVGEFHRALRLAESEDVPFGRAHLGLAKTYFQLEDFQQARSEFGDAIKDLKDKPNSDQQLAEAHNGLGETYLEFGVQGFASALQNFQDAARIDYKNKDYLLNLGSTYVKVGQPDPAIKVLDRTIAIDPQMAKAYDARAQAHGMLARQRAGELELAVADFAKAIQLDPIDRTFYFNLGTFLLQNQRPLEAIGAYTKGIDVDQQLAKAAAAEAKAAEEAKSAAPDQSAEQGQPAAPDQPIDQQPPKQPAAPAPQAKKPYEPYIEPVLGRALSFIELGKATQDEAQRSEAYQRAASDGEVAIAMNPLFPAGYLSRGTALRLLKQYDDAISSYTRAAELSADNTQLTSEALYRRGIAWYYKDEPGLAMIDFIRASQNTPEDVRPYMWQGFLHSAEGNYYEAIAAYSKATEQNERFIPAFRNRGLAYLHLGQFEKAESDFNQVIRIDPANAAAYYQRGIAQDLMDEPAKAKGSYQMAIHLDPAHSGARRKLGMRAAEPAKPAPATSTPAPLPSFLPDGEDFGTPERAPALELDQTFPGTAVPPSTAPLPELPPPQDATIPPTLDELFPDAKPE